ncbi:MAG: histidine kinase [Acidobacteria bacterium]|nr:histidine kinase [Acidobacteriota bacterium]
MHPILEERGRLVPYLAAWIPAGGLLAALVAVVAGASTWSALALALPLALAFGMLSLTAWFPCRSQPLGRGRLLAVVATQVFAALVTSGAWIGFGWFWARLLALAGRAGAPGLLAAPRQFALAAPALATAGVLLFLLSAAVHYLVIAFQSARAAERSALEASLAARDAELRALRAQLDPHFLFNSLNSISALVAEDPPEARRMCVLLAEFLRRTLELGRREVIPLSDELALADAFLGLERVRFGERLVVERDIAPAALGCLVPPLILQPLLENAVRHGIGELLEGGTVRIEAARGDGRLQIAITNPRDAAAGAPGRRGLGLDNVRSRLAALYGAEGRLDVTAGETTYRAALRLPALEGGDGR